MKRIGKLEAILWSIALPGFSQILMGKVIRGLLFVLLEIFINIRSNFNAAIKLSFLGKTNEAITIVDYQWLMFYPCLYMFAMWDAYCSANPPTEKDTYSFLPFVFGAYFITVGLMYSERQLFGILFGPVFLPMIALLPGMLIGFLIKKILLLKMRINGI